MPVQCALCGAVFCVLWASNSQNRTGAAEALLFATFAIPNDKQYLAAGWLVGWLFDLLFDFVFPWYQAYMGGTKEKVS